jgi:hypothetical protein
MSTEIPSPGSEPAAPQGSQPAPLRGWALELARRWNAATSTLFVLHGNIFDVFPTSGDSGVLYGPLKAFLARRLFPARSWLMFYDIGDGLTFASAEMQQRFFEWLEIFDRVEGTNFGQSGPPREFTRLAPLLRRFFLRADAPADERSGVTLIIDFPEKIIPAAEESGATQEERMALVTLLKWATSPEFRRLDIGVVLVTEAAADLNVDLLQNPHVAQIRIDLPDAEERTRFIGTELDVAASDLDAAALAQRTAGLNLIRVRQLIAEALRNRKRLTGEHVTGAKKRLIEEYCQGLVRFKDPKPGVSLELVRRTMRRSKSCATSPG